MKQWKRLLILAMAFSLLIPAALWAAVEETDGMEEETPTFQNAAQLERALNLANSSFTEVDMVEARQQATGEATGQVETLATNYANEVVDQIAVDQAYQQVKQLTRDHAINSVDTAPVSILDVRAMLHADTIVEKKAHNYALSVADGNRTEYQEAYKVALARATDPSFHNPWDTAYQEAIAKGLDEEKFSVWQKEYDYAIARATNPDYHNAYDTAYDSAKTLAMEADVWQDAFDYAIARATNPDYSNAYQAEYKKALEAAVADITGRQLEEIHQMRYVDKLGWGVITKKRLGLHASHSGLGNKSKHLSPPSLDDEIIPPGPPEPDEISFEEEIAEVTRRNTMTGWNDDPGFQAKGKRSKGSKKEYGRAQTSGLSGLASEDVRGKRNPSKGNSQNKSSSGNSGKSDAGSGTQAAASNQAKDNNGNSNKSDKSSNKGGKSSSNNGNNKSGNNGNKGGGNNSNNK